MPIDPTAPSTRRDKRRLTHVDRRGRHGKVGAVEDAAQAVLQDAFGVGVPGCIERADCRNAVERNLARKALRPHLRAAQQCGGLTREQHPRGNRTLERTNESTRRRIPGMLFRKAVKGELPLMQAARAIQDELMAPSALPESDDTPLADERRGVAAFKKVALFVSGAAMQRFGDALQEEQEVLSSLADIVIDAYAAESAVLRALAAQGTPDAPLHAAAAVVVTHEAAGRIELAARAALAALGEGDTLRTHLAALRRLLKLTPANLVVRRRLLADAAVSRAAYPFA